MATVTFHSSMPVGLRLQALFSAIVGGVSYGNEAGIKTASFRIMIYENLEDAFYAGPTISGEAGEVSYLRFGPESAPWLTIGALGGPVQFTYTDLRQQGQLPEAEAAAYEWRNASPLVAKLFIEIVATALTQPNPATLDDTRLARMEEVVEATKSANGSQALGWYHYNKNGFAKARQWFTSSVAWEANETNVLGLALAAHRANDRALFRKTLADYGKQYKAIAALQTYDKPQGTAGKREATARRRGGGGGAGGGTPQSGQLANAAVEQFKNGQYREALATLDKRAAVAKEDQGLGVLRGWALYHLSQYDKARAQFTELDKKRSTRDTQYGMYY